MYALLIWDAIPEESEIYLIPPDEKKALGLITALNGKYANKDELTKAEFDMFSQLSDMLEKTKGQEGTGTLEKYKVKVPLIILEDTKVFRCGWYA
jgi:hypothetical protein